MNENEKLLVELCEAYKGLIETRQDPEAMAIFPSHPLLLNYRRLHNEVLSLMEKKPARWIDGATQLPEVGDEIRAKKEPSSNYGVGHWYSVSNPKAFNDVQWILSSDFPMPEKPEVKIPPCPVCGSECCVATIPHVAGVHCEKQGCYYRVRTLEEHNKLCKGLK